MKRYTFLLGFLALAASTASSATGKYKEEIAQLACGDAYYTLTSSCVQSGDPFELNICESQSLLVENIAGKRRITLPELPRSQLKRIRADGGDAKRLFVVAWACSNTAEGRLQPFIIP